MFLAVSVVINADPVDLYPPMTKIIEITDFSMNNMGEIDGYDGGIIRPWFEGEMGIAFILSNNVMNLYDYNNLEKREVMIRTEEYTYVNQRFANTIMTFYASFRIAIIRHYNKQISKIAISIPDNFYYFAIFDNLILLGNNRGTHCRYASILVEPDGTWKELNHEETLEFLQDKGTDFRYDGKYLFYKNNVLRGSRDIIDDDGNQYSGISIMINSKNVFTMKTPDDLNISSTMFDPEGNFWAVAYTPDEKRNPVIYYAGRDWGYTENPRQAITTTNNLRLRLRADTGALILSSLPNASPVTILKTGPSETIDGLTAPWYKIKTVDGLIGWAFGGYIQIQN